MIEIKTLRLISTDGFLATQDNARRRDKSAELKREVERGSTFTCDLSCIASISFANVTFTHVRA